MSDQFKALIINQEGDSFTREVKSIDKSYLKHGDVTVKVEYSGLNYKDALILKVMKNHLCFFYVVVMLLVIPQL